jgi:dihydrofolate synthase/folylpolyglutamate synthase
MTYSQVLDRLFSLSPSLSAKSSLSTAEAFHRALDFPTFAYPTIHIAGSNGKGSVTTKIAKVLELSGYRVGVYTSPHLFSFRERMVINSLPISEEEVVEGLNRLFQLEQDLNLTATFFELTTFLAFEYFRNHQVDVAVIETGLGGRLDATNVIHPLLTVITSISREHTQILGEEIELIAAEKAGIIKSKIPVVLGPKARAQAIYNRAKELDCQVFIANKLSAFYDEENTEIAHLALKQLTSFTISTEALALGLTIRPSCRFERIGEVLFDVAHNPEAIFYLLQALHYFYPHSRFRFLVGFSKDKEYDRCLDLIADVATHIHLVQAPSQRAAKVEELAEALKHEDPALYTAHPSIGEGVIQAYDQAVSKGEVLVICGSFYIMAEAKRALGYDPTAPFDLMEKTFSAVLSSP